MSTYLSSSPTLLDADAVDASTIASLLALNVPFTRWRIHPMFILLFCGVAAHTVFQNSMDGMIIMDDGPAIIGNKDLRSSKTSWTDLFIHDYWGQPIDHEKSHKSYRPFTVFTFRWTYEYMGIDIPSLHAGNIFLHSFATIGFAALLHLTVGHSLLTLIGGLMFALHPVHVEAIASIVGRAEPLAAAFAVLAMLMYRMGT